MKKGFWFKIITILVIQAILLTQAEFALAALFSSKDLCREAALKYQKITNKTVSLIFGIASLEPGSKSFELDRIFSLLTGNTERVVESLFEGKVSIVSKQIYKVFAICFDPKYDNKNEFVALVSVQDSKAFNLTKTVQLSRAPPMSIETTESKFKSRIV
jgi:hypothetical protein